MAERLFNNKYRVDTVRRSNWDYSCSGAYFITICTQSRKPFFGRISDNEMKHSELGEVVRTEWMKTLEIRKDMNVQLGQWVVMPDHFHAIVIIGINPYNSNYIKPINNKDTESAKKEFIPDIFMHHFKPSVFGSQSKNLASIIRGFNSSVTTYAKKKHIEFCWQASFHCSIIQTIEDLERVSLYIENNIENWKS